MTVTRGIESRILVQYAAFDEEATYELKIKGCEDSYSMTLESQPCNDHILFSVTIPCTEPTGSFTYQILENDISIQEGTLFIND